MKCLGLFVILAVSQLADAQIPTLPSSSTQGAVPSATNKANGKIVIGLTKDMSPVIIEASETALEKATIYQTVHSFGRIDAQTGLIAFTPIEHWIKNENDPTHPWIRIDTYRLGLGGQVGHIFGTLNALENADQFKFNEGSHYWNSNINYVKDIMVIHPSVTGPNQNFLNVIKLNINVIKNFKLAVKGLTEQLIDSPQFVPGDMIVSNSVVSFGALYDTQPGILAFGPGISAGVSFARTHQISVLKLDQNQVVAHWSKIHDINLNIEGGLRLALFSLPVIGFKNEFRTEKEQGYAFDVTDSAQKASLLKNLHTSNPRFDINPKPLDSKIITDMLRTYLISAVGLVTRSHSVLKRHEIDYGPNGPDAEIYEKVVQSRKRSFWFRNVLLNDQNAVTAKLLKPDPSQSGLTDVDKMNLTFSFDYDKKYATLKDYKHVYENVITLMPDEIRQIKPDVLSAQPFLGHLTFRGRVQFKSSALKEIFGQHLTDLEICKNFYNVLPLTISTEDSVLWTSDRWCTTFIPRLRPSTPQNARVDAPLRPKEALEMVRKLRIEPYEKATDIATAINETDSFLTKFKGAQEAIEKARAGNKKLAKVADKIQEMGSGTDLLKSRIEALQSLVTSGEIVRDAVLSSDVGGFIGRPNEIKITAENQNGAPSPVEALELTKSASEVLLYQVRNYFYNLFRYSTPRLIENISLDDARP